MAFSDERGTPVRFQAGGAGSGVLCLRLRMSGVRCAVWGLGFAGRLVFKALRLCVSLNSRLESKREEEERIWCLVLEASGVGFQVCCLGVWVRGSGS